MPQPSKNAGGSPVTAGKQRIRVAVASGSGELVDKHFATSSFFYIYEYDGGLWRRLEIRPNADVACACDQGLNHRSFDLLGNLLADCHFIVAFRIGPAAAIALFQRGIRAHVAFGPIEEVLREFQLSSKFQHPLLKKERSNHE